VHTFISYKSYTDELTTILIHGGDGENVKRLFYATVHSLMKDQ